MKKRILLFLSIVMITSSCYKDIDDTPPSEVIIEISDVLVNTSISGTVVDMEGNTLSSYNLLVNNQLNAIPSDYFLLQLENVKKKGQTIHVFKDDNQIGIRTQLLVENDINHIEILQHEVFKNEIINSGNQHLDISKSLRFNFSNTKWSDDYSGEISVDYVYIQETNSLTPVGYTPLSDVVAVDSKGGFYLKTKNSDGEATNALKANPIILQISDLDPNVNGLFVFDESEEIWILVDEIMSGDEVEILGEGYYSFGIFTPGVFVEGKVSKENNTVAYQPMQWNLTSLSNQFCATEKGRWFALLPENEKVEINLLSPCDDYLQTETLDVNKDDISGQNLIIENGDNYQQLEVAVLDCNGDMISNPNFNIISDESNIRYVFTEEYSERWLAVCDEFSIAAFDEATGLSGTEMGWSTNIVGNFDVLTNCSDLSGGFSYIKIRDEVELYPSFELEIEGDRSILRSTDGNIQFAFRGQEARLYNGDEVNVFINENEFGEKGYYIKCQNSSLGCGITHFNVTHFDSDGSSGGMIRVSFSGSMWMQTLSPSVAGEFDVEGVIVIKR